MSREDGIQQLIFIRERQTKITQRHLLTLLPSLLLFSGQEIAAEIGVLAARPHLRAVSGLTALLVYRANGWRAGD